MVTSTVSLWKRTHYFCRWKCKFSHWSINSSQQPSRSHLSFATLSPQLVSNSSTGRRFFQSSWELCGASLRSLSSWIQNRSWSCWCLKLSGRTKLRTFTGWRPQRRESSDLFNLTQNCTNAFAFSYILRFLIYVCEYPYYYILIPSTAEKYILITWMKFHLKNTIIVARWSPFNRCHFLG